MRYGRLARRQCVSHPGAPALATGEAEAAKKSSPYRSAAGHMIR